VTEEGAAFIALAWLAAAVVLVARSVRRGRDLADDLAASYPETYEELGRPRPGYFMTLRQNRFTQFIARREYAGLGDARLTVRFEEYRQAEARLLIVLLASLAVACLVIYVLRHIVLSEALQRSWSASVS
jgi:alkylation response protein AidB-like acyl-CoA dehydrogenase